MAPPEEVIPSERENIARLCGEIERLLPPGLARSASWTLHLLPAFP